MSTIEKHLHQIEDILKWMDDEKHVREPNEFVAVEEIRIAVHEARKVFEERFDFGKE